MQRLRTVTFTRQRRYLLIPMVEQLPLTLSPLYIKPYIRKLTEAAVAIPLVENTAPSGKHCSPTSFYSTICLYNHNRNQSQLMIYFNAKGCSNLCNTGTWSEVDIRALALLATNSRQLTIVSPSCN